MRRLDNERGAVAVIVAILMMALLGFAAISVDVANMASDKQQLQNGADAAALALAQSCAEGNCGSYDDLADAMASENRNDLVATADVIDDDGLLTPSDGEVTVETAGVTEHWFAPVLAPNSSALDSTTIAARATAKWGTVASGTAVLPVAISACQIDELVKAVDPTFVIVDGEYQIDNPSKVEVVIPLIQPSNKDDECIPLGAPAIVPGGFSWITDGLKDGQCSVETVVGDKIFSDPGAPPPDTCTLAYLKSLVTSEVPIAIPVFKLFYGAQGGANSYYFIHAYAGFKLTGFGFTNKIQYNSPCVVTGNTRCLSGYFTEVVDFTGDLDPDAANYGAHSVVLTK